jgi:hypothetical protein
MENTPRIMRSLAWMGLLLMGWGAWAQEVPTTYKGEKGKGSVIEGDTIPWVFLDEILVVDKPTFTDVEARKRYLLLRRRVLKVYPYAKVAGERLDSLNMRLAREKSARKRAKYTKQYQDFLEQRFEAELRKLTRSEGQILCKLVYRETDQTVFQLIREYRNWFTAVGWSVTGSWYDINIRKEYDPKHNQEDALIEKILRRSFALGDLKERIPMDVHGKPRPRR